MVEPLQTGLTLLSLLLAALALVQVVMDRPTGAVLLGLLGLLTAGLLVLCVVGIVQVVREDPAISTATFVAYLVGLVVLVPIGALWALSERSRSGTAVLIVLGLVVPVMLLRVEQIWMAGGG